MATHHLTDDGRRVWTVSLADQGIDRDPEPAKSTGPTCEAMVYRKATRRSTGRGSAWHPPKRRGRKRRCANRVVVVHDGRGFCHQCARERGISLA